MEMDPGMEMEMEGSALAEEKFGEQMQEQ